MKRWKKAGLLTLLMGGCFAAGAAASNGIEKVEAFLRPDFKVVVNGVVAQLDNPVLIYNETSYLPVKAVGTLFGAQVNWDGQTNSIYVDPSFPDKPVVPDTTEYSEIRMQQTYGNKVNFRGREYGMLSVTTSTDTYYRVIDLARMGIDTRGVPKVKEEYTGFLFIKQEEAYKLWGSIPEMYATYEPVTSGVYDTALRDKLLDWATNYLPELGKQYPEMYPDHPYVYFIDAVEGRSNWFYMLGRNNRDEMPVFVMEYVKDKDEKWQQKSYQGINIKSLRKFIDDKK